MAKKQFKAESRRLLDLMINSIYTHKEIFLRELISNASDALDKLYYQSITQGQTGINRESFAIRIERDKEQRTLTVSDNGIGMTREEMEDNLGTIARSGTLQFRNGLAEAESMDEMDIIGQFGVGFYSAFMVSDKVTVVSRAYGQEQAWVWESTGADGYTLKEGSRAEPGTDVILKIKRSTGDEDYEPYLSEYRIQELVRRYSDYIRYPIRMLAETHKPLDAGEEDGAPAYETVLEWQTLNSMVPVWKKQKKELAEGELSEFYQNKFHDFTPPARVIHSSVEGAASYTALLFVPGRPPYNYYSRDYEKGLQLYSSGVLIMDKCPELLPDCFSFVRGLVDSQDLSLNISREMLQHDRQLRAIAERLEKKIRSELLEMQKNEREDYEAFFRNFGLQLKYGVYDRFGLKAEELSELLLFPTSLEGKYATLAEYAGRMPEDQKYLYYAAADSVEKAGRLPQTELLREKGYEILYLTDDVDEFALQALRTYGGKEFRSVTAGELDLLDSEADKAEAEKQALAHKDLLDYMQQRLAGKVAEVRLSGRLKGYPVCLAAKGGLSLEMEKVLRAMPLQEEVRAERVLELNGSHRIMEALTRAYEEDKARLDRYTDLLYDQALLLAGFAPEDPAAFGNAVCDLMI